MIRAPGSPDDLPRPSALAAQFASLLPKRPIIFNMGSELGATFRRLAPIIGRAQAWLFAESDENSLGLALDAAAQWAEAQGWTVTWPGRALLLHRPSGAWRIEGLVADMTKAPPVQMRQADGVVCGALLERVPAAWIGGLASVLHSPLLACGLADGRVTWMPRDPGDAMVARFWRRSLARDAGLGPAVGADAAATIRRTLAPLGFSVRTATAEQRVPARSAFTPDLVRDIALEAGGVAGRCAGRIGEWEIRRGRLALQRRLGARIGYVDLLATPAEAGLNAGRKPSPRTKKGADRALLSASSDPGVPGSDI